MGYQTSQSLGAAVWALADRQHGVVARRQLLELGFHSQAIKHRVAMGRLHPVCRGVYAVGRPQVDRYGRWMAAVLSCGPGTALSHSAAAALWEIMRMWPREIEVTVPTGRRRPGIVVHRADLAPSDLTSLQGIPVTTPFRTLMDIATQLTREELEAAIKPGRQTRSGRSSNASLSPR